MRHYYFRFRMLVLPAFLFFSILSCSREKKEDALKNTAWLEEITIAQLQQGYRDGKFTITDVVKAYLTRIDSIDRNGPKLNSIITLNPDALEIAGKLDREMKSG